MYCSSCGKEIPDESKFCPICGATVSAPGEPTADAQAYSCDTAGLEPQSIGVVGRFASAFRDKLFMAVCILMSTALGLSILSSAVDQSLSLNVISLLFVIFLWMIFAGAQKNTVNLTGMKGVSGTMKALCILLWIAVGFLALFGIIFFAVPSLLGGLFETALQHYEEELSGLFVLGGSMVSVAIGFVFLFMAVILTLFNIFGYHSIHRMMKTMCTSVLNNYEQIDKLKAGKGWLMAFGVLNGLSALTVLATSPMNALATGSTAAALIIASIWVDRHFIKGIL